MLLNEFEEHRKHFNFIDLTENYILFEDLELYNNVTEESQKFNNIEELLEIEIDGKKITDIIKEFQPVTYKLEEKDASGGKRQKTFRDNDDNTRSSRKDDLPARMNKLYNGNRMSKQHTLDTFRAEHARSGKEHIIVYDDNGFVSNYGHGASGSVNVSGLNVEGKNVMHNHPKSGYAQFSKADLRFLAGSKAKSIGATSANATYIVTKTPKFNANGFIKALDKAQTTSTDYNKAVDSFLRQNAKRYGYTYIAKKHD